MPFVLRVIVISLALVVSGCATTPSVPPAGESLGDFIEARISTPPFHRAVWGIYVEEEDGTLLYETNGDTLMIPASNRKLFTVALNESCFALDSRIPTELWVEGRIVGRALLGNVVIRGYGDPSFGGRHVHGLHDEMFAPFVDALRQLGIETVTGAVIGDGSAFDRETMHGTWQFEDLGTSYQAPIDALAFNENVVGLFYRFPDCETAVLGTDPAFVGTRHFIQCGPARSLVFSSAPDNTIQLTGTVPAASRQRVELVSIRDASLYAAQGLHDVLVRSGIDVQQQPRPGLATATARRISTVSSPFLFDLLATMMKASQNLYADALFKRIAIDGDGDPASFDEALEIERLFLTGEVGIHPDAFSFEDGSGLSVRNLVSPRAIVQLMRWLDAPPRRGANEVVFTIPEEGEGTLRRRLGGLDEVFHGKTGTLTGVNALSGILRLPDGRRRYVSIIVNHHAAPSSSATAIVDEIIQRLARP